MKIGIIGSGGAGMCAAWLLDEEHEVTLLEKNDYLGGNTHTVRVNINGQEHLVDDGAAWFSPKIYPHLNAFMDLTGVEYDMAPMSLTFHNKLTGNSTCMPPVELQTIYKMFSQRHALPEVLALYKVLNVTSELVKAKNTSITYKEFMQGMSGYTQLKETFLRPLLTALWGSPFSETDGFAMYPMVKYMVSHKPIPFTHYKMKVMRGGCQNYIGTVRAKLNKTGILLKDAVASIMPSEENKMVSVTTSSGKSFEFDHLIIAASAYDTRAILKNSKGFEGAAEILHRFKYYKALLATHSDISLMPPNRSDWSLVNVMSKGTYAASTIWSGKASGTDLFCSYIQEGERPQFLHHISEWWLPVETPEFFQTQKQLEPLQGLGKVWFAGDYTHDIGSHEDAIVSAVKAVERVAKTSNRLKALKRKMA